MSDYIYFYVYLTKKLNIIKYYKNMDFEKDTATKDFLSLIEIIIIGITALAVYNIILKCILTILMVLIIISMIIRYDRTKIPILIIKNIKTNNDYKVLQSKLSEYVILDKINKSNIYIINKAAQLCYNLSNNDIIKQNKYNDWSLEYYVKTMNIQCLTNFASNIIYLNFYHNLHRIKEDKYIWINKTLKTFYSQYDYLTNEKSNLSNNILKTLKN